MGGFTFASQLIVLACAVGVVFGQGYCGAPLPVYHGAPGPSFTLIQAIALTRHGDRAPANVLPYERDVEWNCDNTEAVRGEFGHEWPILTIPEVAYSIENIPSAPTSFHWRLWRGNCTIGQLTERGAMQHVFMGRAMREILVEKAGLLPKELTDPSDLYVRSTDIWRTKQSAAAHIAGLYPTESGEGRLKAAAAAVKIKRLPSAVETISPNEGACPRITAIIAAKMKTAAWADHMAETAALHKRLETICGISPGTHFSESFDAFADAFHTRLCHGFPLPCSATTGECVTENDAAAVFKFVDWENAFLYGDDAMCRLSMTPLANEFVALMRSANATSYPKYALFSGHDDSVTTMLCAFRLDTSVWPAFASNLVFELWKNTSDGGLIVRMAYNGRTMAVPGCANGKNGCTWEEFEAIVKSRLTVKDLRAECASK